MHKPVDQLAFDPVGSSEQAGDNNRSQTSFLRRKVPRMGYGSGNSLFRLRECPGHRFVSRQLASKPKAAGGKHLGV